MNRTIIIADTDIVLLEILRSRCRALGLHVETAHRGDDAVRLIRRVRPCLACIPHDMPCIDGRTLCETLVDNPQTSGVPLIVLYDQPVESIDRPFRELGAYMMPRGGNLWHRLEPLIYELVEQAERDSGSSCLPADDSNTRAVGEQCSAPAAVSRPAPDLRIDEPPRRSARAGDTGIGAWMASASAPRKDARESVLDAVFAWFGHARDTRETAAAAETSPTGLTGPHRRDSAEPPWVLCIEDDSDFSLALKLRLEGHGIAVVRAFDGRGGYRAAFTHRASAILLDYNLPQGQGDYVLRRLKENPVTADVPVIVLTGIRSAATRRQMLALGADAYLTKPLDFEELIDALSEHVDVLPREFAAASY